MAFVTSTNLVQTLVQEGYAMLHSARQGLLRAVRLFSAPNNYKVFGVAASTAAGTVPAGKTWLIFEVDNTTALAQDEKAFGIKAPADAAVPS